MVGLWFWRRTAIIYDLLLFIESYKYRWFSIGCLGAEMHSFCTCLVLRYMMSSFYTVLQLIKLAESSGADRFKLIIAILSNLQIVLSLVRRRVFGVSPCRLQTICICSYAFISQFDIRSILSHSGSERIGSDRKTCQFDKLQYCSSSSTVFDR